MRVIRSAALVLTAVLLVQVPGLASADVRKHTDPATDVQYYVNTDPSDVPPPKPVPDREHGDITVVRVANDASNVRVVVYFRALRRTGQFHGHVFRFVAGTVERRAQITAGPDERHGWTGDAQLSTTSGRTITCRAMTHTIDYAHRQLTLKVPRHCLNNPASVRVGVGTVMLAGKRTYFDDGFRTRGTMGGVALKPTLGPAVSR